MCYGSNLYEILMAIAAVYNWISFSIYLHIRNRAARLQVVLEELPCPNFLDPDWICKFYFSIRVFPFYFSMRAREAIELCGIVSPLRGGSMKFEPYSPNSDSLTCSTDRMRMDNKRLWDYWLWGGSGRKAIFLGASSTRIWHGMHTSSAIKCNLMENQLCLRTRKL